MASEETTAPEQGGGSQDQPAVSLTIDELRMLDAVAARTGRSVSDLVGDAMGRSQATGATPATAAVPPQGAGAAAPVDAILAEGEMAGPAAPEVGAAAPGDVQGPATDAATEPVVPAAGRAVPAAGRAAPAAEPVVPAAGDSDLADPAAAVDPAEDGSAGRRRRPPLLGIAAGVMIIGLIVALVLSQLALRDRDDAVTARNQAVTAAQQYAIDLAAYNYQSIDTNFARLLDHATPTFVQKFNQTTSGLKALLVKFHASATAKVLGAAAESVTSTHAAVLVDLDQTVTNTEQKSGPTTSQSRLRVDLVRSGGGWRVNDIDYVQ